MTVTRGFALLLTVAAAGALVNASAPGAAIGGRIKTISSRANAKGASLVIEATEPVAYVATAPDPLTVVLDFRNVVADGAANSVTADSKSPIASVAIEAAEDSRGAPASRVRIALAQPVAHHIRSERNTIVIDFDKPSAKVAPYVLPPVGFIEGRARRHAGAAAADAARVIRSARSDSIPCCQVRYPRPCRPARHPRRLPRPSPAPGPIRRWSRRRRSSPRRRRLRPAADVHTDAPAVRLHEPGHPLYRGIPSASIFRAPICAPCCARLPKSAA